jgi:PAS domain S-box-containing protein
MADMERLTWPVRRRGDFLRIISYIILATALIFVIDVITPLGVVVWVLYLIPLFLTMYLSWKYAPHLMTGVFIILMAGSLFLSPRDIPLGYAIIDRVFFALILIISSFFIRDYIASVEEIAQSEERYRSLVEWLPVGIAVYQENRIVYLNPAGRQVIGIREDGATDGVDIAGMIEPPDRELFRERVGQAAQGARITMENVRLARSDGSTVSLDINLGRVLWDRSTALQIVMRPA